MALRKLEFDFSPVLGWCIRAIAEGVDYGEYVARLREYIEDPRTLDTEAEWKSLPPEERWRMAIGVARSAWRQLPHPAWRFAPAPLAEVRRNDRCFCGSGRKFKQCCFAFEGNFLLGGDSLVPHLVDALAPERWRDLVDSRIDLEAVRATARGWADRGHEEDAFELLELWFEDDRHFTRKHRDLVWLLSSLYAESGFLQINMKFLGRAERHGDATVRPIAQRLQATTLIDNGLYGMAQAVVGRIARKDAEDGRMAFIEIPLLYAEGRHEEARALALRWRMQLEAIRAGGFEAAIDELASMATPTYAQSLRPPCGSLASGRHLLQILRKVGPPQVEYEFVQEEGEPGLRLRPSEALGQASGKWEELHRLPVRTLADPDDDPELQWAAANDWLDLLESDPILWNCVDVIDDLQQLLDSFGNSGLLGMRKVIIDHGIELLGLLAEAHAGPTRLSSEGDANRAALALLAEGLLRRCDASLPDAHQAALEKAVAAFEPFEDRHFRARLLHAYMVEEHLAEAIDLAERFPDDGAPMSYAHALALLASGQHEEAGQRLRAAIARWPKARSWLLGRNPLTENPDRTKEFRPPDPEFLAWLIGGDWLSLWKRDGALDWLRSVEPEK